MCSRLFYLMASHKPLILRLGWVGPFLCCQKLTWPERTALWCRDTPWLKCTLGSPDMFLKNGFLKKKEKRPTQEHLQQKINKEKSTLVPKLPLDGVYSIKIGNLKLCNFPWKISSKWNIITISPIFFFFKWTLPIVDAKIQKLLPSWPRAKWKRTRKRKGVFIPSWVVTNLFPGCWLVKDWWSRVGSLQLVFFIPLRSSFKASFCNSSSRSFLIGASAESKAKSKGLFLQRRACFKSGDPSLTVLVLVATFCIPQTPTRENALKFLYCFKAASTAFNSKWV